MTTNPPSPQTLSYHSVAQKAKRFGFFLPTHDDSTFDAREEKGARKLRSLFFFFPGLTNTETTALKNDILPNNLSFPKSVPNDNPNTDGAPPKRNSEHILRSPLTKKVKLNKKFHSLNPTQHQESMIFRPSDDSFLHPAFPRHSFHKLHASLAPHYLTAEDNELVGQVLDFPAVNQRKIIHAPTASQVTLVNENVLKKDGEAVVLCFFTKLQTLPCALHTLFVNN